MNRYKKTMKMVVVTMALLFLFSSSSLALDNQVEVKVVSLEEATEMALQASFDKVLLEFQNEKLRNNENIKYQDINSVSNDSRIPRIQKEETSNSLTDLLNVFRMNQAALEDSKELQDILIKYNVTAQYITILSLEKQKTSLEKNLEQAEKLLNVERLKKQLGLSDDTMLENVFNNVQQLEKNLAQLKIQMDSAYVDFRKTIGLELTAKIELHELEATEFHIPSYDKGLENALENGLQIRNSQRDVTRKENYVKDMKDRYPQGESSLNEPKIDLREAKANLEENTKKTELNYKTAYNDLLSKKEKLDLSTKDENLALKTLNTEKLKYEVGMSSKIELDAKATDYEVKELARKQAEYDYMKSQEAYKLARDGIFVYVK